MQAAALQASAAADSVSENSSGCSTRLVQELGAAPQRRAGPGLQGAAADQVPSWLSGQHCRGVLERFKQCTTACVRWHAASCKAASTPGRASAPHSIRRAAVLLLPCDRTFCARLADWKASSTSPLVQAAGCEVETGMPRLGSARALGYVSPCNLPRRPPPAAAAGRAPPPSAILHSGNPSHPQCTSGARSGRLQAPRLAQRRVAQGRRP